MKKCIGMFLFVFAMIGVFGGINIAKAEEQKGNVNFVLSYTQEQIEMYTASNPNDGAGVYVFLQNIDNSTVYRFPLNSMNHYAGRYEVPYGNYRVISNPDAKAGQVVISCNSVFTISDSSPSVKAECYVAQIPKSKKTQVKKPATTTNPPVTQTEEKSGGFSIQNIITIIVMLVLIGIWVYNRFFKFRETKFRNGEE